MFVIPKYVNKLPIQQIFSIIIQNICTKFINKFSGIHAHLLLWRYAASVGCNLQVSGRLRCFSKGIIIIGDNVRINSGPCQNYIGGDRRTSLWVSAGAQINIENGVAISNSTIVSRTSVLIKKNTFIGGGCDIYDNDFHELLPEERANHLGNIGTAPVEIGPAAFIGGHSIILKGVKVGEGSVIGAGSLVANDIPDYQVWAGRPAKFIRTLARDNTLN